MHIKLSEAMFYLNMTHADLADVVPDPFGNVFDDPKSEDDNDPRWSDYFNHLKCVQKWERIADELGVAIKFLRSCTDAGFKAHLHGNRVMSWFLTEIKNPDQEFIR